MVHVGVGDNGRSTVGTVLLAVPDGARAVPIARAFAAELLMPVVAFGADDLLAFAADRSFAAIVVDPDVDPANDPRALLAAVRAVTPAPIIVLGFEPGRRAVVHARGVNGLLSADAPAADVVGTVLTAIALSGAGSEVLAHDDLVVDAHNFEAWQGAQRLDLTPTELRLLAELVAAGGDLVTKPALQKAAWGSASGHDDNRLQAHIRRLRTKLAGPGGGTVVRTVRGLGFRLETRRVPAGAPVHEATQTVHEPW